MACLPLGIVIGEAAVLGEDLEAHVEKARRQPACRGAALGCRMSGVGCWVSGKDIRVSARSRLWGGGGGEFGGELEGGKGGDAAVANCECKYCGAVLYHIRNHYGALQRLELARVLSMAILTK